MSTSFTFLWSLLRLSVVLILSQCLGKKQICKLKPDPVFSGLYVDCSNLRLTRQNLTRLPFHNVTSLDISDNNIGYLPDHAFVRFKHLKCLMCTRCNLDGMGNYSLKGLDTLEILRLDYNKLDMVKWRNNKQPTIPRGVFRHVPRLKQLYLNHNGKYDMTSPGYSQYLPIFEYLPQITHLSIDSFKNLTIGEEFLVFRKLYSLNISCRSLRAFTNDSLKGFQSSTVKLFELRDGDVTHHLYTKGLDIFENLPNVSYLSLKEIRVGNQNALRMMKPLVGRRIPTIIFDAVYFSAFMSFEDKVSDTIVTTEDAKYLRDVNVSNFIWFNSGIYNLEYDMPLSKTWQNDLKSMVLQSDALIETSIRFLFEAVLLKNIEHFAFFGSYNQFGNQFIVHGGKGWNPVLNSINSQGGFAFKDIEFFPRDKKFYIHDDKESRGFSSTLIAKIENNYKGSVDSIAKRKEGNEYYQKEKWEFWTSANCSLGSSGKSVEEDFEGGHFKIRLPPRVRSIILDSGHYYKLNLVYTLFENKLDTLIVSNTLGFLQLHGTMYGLDNLTTLSFHGSQHLDMSLNFLDTFPGLKVLDLTKTSTFPEFYHTHGTRLIQALTSLEYFSLADNGLERLPPGMFLTNKQLKYVNLAGNRLSSPTPPFNLELTPALEMLDLTGNSIVDLNPEKRDEVDAHIRVKDDFVLVLENNQLSCTCSRFSFIVWLLRRRDHFDMEGNYPCISEDGLLTYTAAFADTKVFWRQCRGGYYLMLSAILACSLVALYLALFLGMKNKTAIISKVMQVVVPGFRLKTRRDYRFDVCIGYADQDGTWVRQVLLSYIEDKWGLSTFVHQRDLRQDPLEMSNALGDSWRCLLLVTETFLFRYQMAHNVMKVSSFFVSPSNPRSVVVMVEESVRHRVPDYVLQVVHEDNILVLPSLEPELDYETKEFLKTRLT